MEPAAPRIAIALLALVILASCNADDNGVPENSERQQDTRPSIPLLQGDDEIYSGDFAPTSSNDVIGPIPLRFLQYNTAVLIYGTGELSETKHAGAPYDGHGLIGPDGWAQGGTCYANVAIAWPNGSNAFCKGSRNAPSVYAYAFGQGTIGWRNNAGTGDCGPGTGLQCWDYQGSFHVSITRVSAKASVSASKSVVGPNTTVTFNIGISPATFGPDNLSMPVQVLRWYWKNDNSDTEISPGCSNSPVCWYTPTKSGTMYTEAVENGNPVTVTRRVQFTTCPPVGDSIVDNPDLRQKLLQELAASRPSAAGRRERAFNIYCFDNGACLAQLDPANVNPTPCHSDGSANPVLPDGATRVGNGHTHPSNDGEPYPTGTCTDRPPPAPFENGGGSDADWLSPGLTGAPEYIPSMGNNSDYLISRLDAGVDVNQRPNNPYMWKIRKNDPNACPRR